MEPTTHNDLLLEGPRPQATLAHSTRRVGKLQGCCLTDGREAPRSEGTSMMLMALAWTATSAISDGWSSAARMPRRETGDDDVVMIERAR
jgi:hypothetical protein